MSPELLEPVVVLPSGGIDGKCGPPGDCASACARCGWRDDEPLPPRQAAARYRAHARTCPGARNGGETRAAPKRARTGRDSAAAARKPLNHAAQNPRRNGP